MIRSRAVVVSAYEERCRLVAATATLFCLPFDSATSCETSLSCSSYRHHKALGSSLLPFFTSALVGGPVEYFHVIEGTAAFADSGVSLPLPVAAHGFVADVWLFSVLPGSQFDLKDANRLYYRFWEDDWEGEASVGYSRM